MAHPLSLRARAFIWAVIAGGIATGLTLAAQASFTAADLLPVIVFGGMALLCVATSISYRGPQPSSITYQMMTAFAYALFLLVDPAATGGVLVLTLLIDKWLNRRDWLRTAFNIGQFNLAVGAAFAVRGVIEPRFDLAWLDPPTVGAATAAIVVFALVNHGLTRVVIGLAQGRRLFRWSFELRTGAMLELLCILSGVGMAVLWCIEPWLASFAAIPTWTMYFLVRVLSQREAQLQARETELRSLQDLGLELGSELDVDRLRESVLRIACDALKPRGALLAQQDDDTADLRVVAARNLGDDLPERLALTGLPGDLFESGKILRLDGAREHAGVGRDPLAECSGALLAPLQIRGRSSGLLLLTHGTERRAFDDTDVHRLESLLRFVNVALSNAELVGELQEVQSQLAHSEKMSALGMLVSGVAHELNNPLTSVLGYAELLHRDEPAPQRRRKLETVAREAKRAGKIVHNLLMFSRKRKPTKRLVDVNQIIHDVLDFRAYEQSVHNIDVERRLSRSLPRVLADGDQFHQVVLNLITNAEQAIGETGRPGTISVRTATRGEQVRIVVSDDGPGIEKQHLKQVFVPFFTTKEVGRGTGLGLAICYGIIQEHGGTIGVSSRGSRGSTFTIEIPAALTRTVQPEPDVQVAAAGRSAQRGRLLVVDDEPDIVDLLTQYFGAQGWHVDSASDGTQALGLIPAGSYDALIVDLRMPGMDGAQLFRELESRHPAVARRVVFATGDAGDTASAEFLERTGAPLVHKPFDLDTLGRAVLKIAEACRESSEERAAARRSDPVPRLEKSPARSNAGPDPGPT